MASLLPFVAETWYTPQTEGHTAHSRPCSRPPTHAQTRRGPRLGDHTLPRPTPNQNGEYLSGRAEALTALAHSLPATLAPHARSESIMLSDAHLLLPPELGEPVRRSSEIRILVGLFRG